MSKSINQIALKSAAEHLESVLVSYPNEPVVQDLLESLFELLEAAKGGRISEPVSSMMDIPGAHNFAEGVYMPYGDPSVGEAYAKLITEMEGGLTQQDEQRHARMEEMWQTIKEGES